MTRELMQRKLQLEQREKQLSAEWELLFLDTEYQENSLEVEEAFKKEMKLLEAKATVQLAEYPEPKVETPVEEPKVEETA